MRNIGIYVHIPFCRSKCPYCDFFSLRGRSEAQAYITCVNNTIETFFATNNCKADTLYIGGGTPSVLSGEQIASVITSVKRHSGAEIGEITVECNPSDVNAVFLQAIHRAGANRLSLGVQSAVDRECRALGRRADKETVAAAVNMAKQEGFRNISLDLMLGIPEQTRESLRESIHFCAALGVQHVSAYLLKIEEGTVFAAKKESLHLPDEDDVADMYLFAVEELAREGFVQYEISNFSLPGFESRHNLKYWHLEEYLGIGAAAHSFLNGKRFYYPRDLAYYLGGGEAVADGTGGTREEKIMLGLRLREGIDIALLSDKATARLPFLCEQGLAACSGTRVALTPEGFLVSNAIIAILQEE